ncbi:MAG: alpha/beta hydrolase [Myxococcota bacterium]|nr:alpha/beta hydrolase [Myxococcota bacterium]
MSESKDPGDAFEIRSERVTANGLEFHVHTCGDGDRLALCLHGFPEIGYTWRHQLPLLASLGYRVWAPDLRGFGQSDKPRGVGQYAIEHLIDDVAALIDASGTKETLLLAHDWGVMIASQIAFHQVRPLEGLVLFNGAAVGMQTETGFSLRALRRTFYAFFFQLPFLPERLLAAGNYQAIRSMFRGRMVGRPDRITREDIRVFQEAMARPGALTGGLNYYRAQILGGGLRRIIARGFPEIETPTLILWGEEDPVLVPSTIGRAEELIADLTLRFLPGVGHWAQQEAPDEVNEMLDAWLKGRSVPGSATLSSEGSSE